MNIIQTILKHAEKLTGNETKLLIALYAKQEEAVLNNGFFNCGTNELSRYAGMTKPTFLRARDGLNGKGFITVLVNGRGMGYRLNLNGKETLPNGNEMLPPSKEMLPKATQEPEKFYGDDVFEPQLIKLEL